MRSDDGADTAWLAVVGVKESSGGLDQGVDACEQLAGGDLAAELAPEHLDWVQPWAVGRKVQQNEAASRAAQPRPRRPRACLHCPRRHTRFESGAWPESLQGVRQPRVAACGGG